MINLFAHEQLAFFLSLLLSLSFFFVLRVRVCACEESYD